MTHSDTHQLTTTVGADLIEQLSPKESIMSSEYQEISFSDSCSTSYRVRFVS